MAPAPRFATVVRYALASRLLCVAWCVVADALLPDHDATGVRRWRRDAAPLLPVWLTRPFTRWDAAHLLGVARFGYASDLDAAFFPAYPALCAAVGRCLAAVGLGAAEALVVAGVLVSNACFVAAAGGAYAASAALLGDEAAAFRAALAFCGTPASVFMSSCYSESLAAACSFWGLAWLVDDRLVPATAALALGAATRSNGALYALVVAARGAARAAARQPAPRRAARLAAAAVAAACVAAPPLVKDVLHHRARGGGAPFSSAYADAQAEGWNVGFLRYWRLRQLPNFALAAPAVGIAAHAFATEARRLARTPRRRLWADARCGAADAAVVRGALAGHGLALALVCVFVAHAEIATRLLGASSLPFYWSLAALEAARPRAVRAYAGLFAVVGPLAHCNFLPWT